MRNDLQKITNLLLLNINNTDCLGLLEGKAGIVLYLYYYSKFTKNRIYQEISDNTLDDLIKEIKPNLPIDFNYGLTGIGWLIQHLLKNNFIESDDDDLLIDLETQIFQSETSNNHNFQFENIFYSRISYLSQILDIPTKTPKYIQEFQNSLNACKYYFLSYTNFIKKPLYIINACLVFLNKLRGAIQFKREAERILFKIYLYLLDNNIDFTQKGDIKILYQIISKINLFPKYKNKLIRKINSPHQELAWKDYLENYIWQFLLYFPDEKNNINTTIIKNNIDIIIENISQDSLSIHNGLAGIGLCLLFQEYDFSNDI